ncbi:SPFH domain-containing protein [Vibrio sp. SCSIO 43136]|uniref:SPFH domain-containing protein n=1 Tax=Vibrio sp. SCSIO 43136 TaxID=2819101 RepID=UPI002074BF06|nr:SPFH domain-containing protein [Vibrio sp. SCSIO 43136]USD64199.1 SPFH domain-containing protein [Vibrio sp. SCSIO 43136]
MDMTNPKKLIATGISAALAVYLGFNTWTTVPAGHVKTQSLFGKVQDEVLTEGFHLVNPLKTLDLMSIRTDKYEINGLNIPTQDRFNSTGNVTVIYNIDENKASYIRKEYGTAEQFIDKTLRQYMRSIVRSEGRKLPDSRSLAIDANVETMQDSARSRLIESLDGTGVEIQEVLVQDIEFDPRIAKQILATQERIQQEEAKKSEERRAATEAEIKRQHAIGEANKKKEAADAEAYRIKQDADARKQAAIDVATGKAEAIRLQAQAEAEALKLLADANLELTESLTPAILERQRLENEGVLYKNSRGNVPHTVIGETDLRAYGIPMAVQPTK